MKSIGWRLQLGLIGVAYASVLFLGTCWFFLRNLQAMRDPLASSGGMWAFGDEILIIFLYLLCLVPTFFLLRLMRTNEAVYSNYAKIVLAVSLTAPLCLAALVFHVGEKITFLRDFYALRFFRSPMLFVVMVMSRLFARERLAKRLLNYALLPEALTMAAAIAIVFMQDRRHV